MFGSMVPIMPQESFLQVVSFNIYAEIAYFKKIFIKELIKNNIHEFTVLIVPNGIYINS